MYYFSADTHLGHFNIIKYTDRPFEDLEEMHDTIITKHNHKVDKDDTVFFLGDFCFAGYEQLEEELNGKFIFLQGNHDGKTKGRKAIIQRMVLDHGGRRLLLVHNPRHITERDSDFYDLALTAHIHNHWKIDLDNFPLEAVNVGVDVWDFEPVTIEEILKRYHKTRNNARES